MSEQFSGMAQVRSAATQFEMAHVLLRLPDAVVLAHHEPIARACRALRFDKGREFVELRINAMNAVRNPNGGQPHALELERRRRELAALRAPELERHRRELAAVHDIVLDKTTRMIRSPMGSVTLTPLEFRFFQLLWKVQPNVLTVEQALSGLYGPDEWPDQKLVTVLVWKLRRRLPSVGIEIATAWGRGYRVVLGGAGEGGAE